MKVLMYDIETLKELFLVIAQVPGEHTRKWEVSKWKNELDSFVSFTESHQDYYWVGYNNLRFDAQVIEWILHNYEQWHEMSGLEITDLISRKAMDVIDDANYDVFPEYKEEELSLPQIDLFRILHYDNKNRKVSLKRVEFEMDMENIEEMPFEPGKTGLTREEIVDVIHYCENDVKATHALYRMVIGKTEHPFYKDNNQIEIRQNAEAEFGIKCLNYSNAKLGDEIIKKYYCEERKIAYAALPKKGTFRKEIELRRCIPSYIRFQTKQLQDFLSEIKKITLKQTQDFIRSIDFYGQTYTFAKGGLHNIIRGKLYEADDFTDIVDVDVSGYYPAIIINNSLYPAHLGKAFLTGYSKTYYRRIELKPKGKKDKKIKGIVAALKEAGNCPYGKSSDMSSWLYDKQMTLATCLIGELSLLMLVEDCELNGIRCIMVNTDGATFLLPKDKRAVFDEIKKRWLQSTTVALTYEMEETLFKKMAFSSVNDYIALKMDGEIKTKGDFCKDTELHKNKSARVVPIALENYFLNGIPVEDTIMNYTNIYDFCIRQKATNCFHYEGVNSEGKTSTYNKLIRHYVSKKGEKLLRVRNENCLSKAVKVVNINKGGWVSTVCNRMGKEDHLPNVNHTYYIERANRIVYKVITEGKTYKPADVNQLTLNFT